MGKTKELSDDLRECIVQSHNGGNGYMYEVSNELQKSFSKRKISHTMP